MKLTTLPSHNMNTMDTISESSETTTESDVSSTRRTAPNFSRPQPQQPSALKSGQKDHSQNRHGHIIDAFHEADQNLPAEPRFSDESTRTDITGSEYTTASSDFAYDSYAGDADSKRRTQRFDDQRFEKSTRPGTAGSTSTTPTSESTFDLGLAKSSSNETRSSQPSNLSSGIVKRVSVDQRSERVSTDQWEDAASHHTVSESGDSGSFDMDGRWQSSDYDTSELSAEKIRKLEKKGINPALYVEMKEARKGKKWAPQLLGNGFLS